MSGSHAKYPFFKNNELWLSKFNGGILSVAKLKIGGIVFSSEERALEAALTGANLEYTLLTLAENKLYFYEGGKLYDNKEKIGIGDCKWCRIRQAVCL